MNTEEKLAHLRRRREEVDAVIAEIKEDAAKLALDDPDAFRAKHAEVEKERIDGERLDAAIREAERRLEGERADAAKKATDEAREEIDRLRKTRIEIAGELDAALSHVEACFNEIESDTGRINDLLRKVGEGGGHVDVNLRAALFVTALWHNCPGFAKRVGIRFAFGGPANFKPLSKSMEAR
jgi:chromosome segregation ATPase